MLHISKSRSILIVGILFGGLFFLIAMLLGTNRLVAFDQQLIQLVQGSITSNRTTIMKGISFFGSFHWIIAPLLILASLLVLMKRTRFAVFLVLSYFSGRLLNRLLKSWFQVDRPQLHQLVSASGFSFPSGHSMNSMIFYGVLSIIIAKLIKQPLMRWSMIIVLGCLVLAVGMSRVYLGVHYPSDVLAGFAAGVFWVCLCSACLQYYEKKKELT
ncbi:phosphatase PAP2 family protein [Salirhabdus sp. Marseille-P4669]|uniref:phosphatase PAP2 family protein n=1 Tax=Salirhabdus sp. Marseille-P4669 TaxID=2042310 RepID=UPI000C797DBC|nr:phosphatase PAP2 family protein [Salirhabdus sp. Marseille-P4669]